MFLKNYNPKFEDFCVFFFTLTDSTRWALAEYKKTFRHCNIISIKVHFINCTLQTWSNIIIHLEV